ncbi:MAG: UDP-N-acetylmuramate dehydrogenase [Candidatus Levyibacteriota bacterium]
MVMQIVKEARLSEILWYKIGGVARFFLECSSKEDVIEAFTFVKKEKLNKYFVVGLGSNLLFTDEYYDGAVIQIASNSASQIKLVDKNTIESFAGVELDQVIQFAFDNNLIGLEWAGGLPGTVGAAVRGNVGAFGSEVSDVFAGAEVLDVSSSRFTVHSLNRRDIKFGYRMSTVKKNPTMIVLSARFKLQKVDDAKLGSAKQEYFANIEYRKNKHPLDYPSTGSAFKNVSEPENVKKVLAVFPDLESDVKMKWHGKVSMGYLIKRLDLSGTQIGNAQISNKHSNFIVNLGNASFQDVISIIKKIQDEFSSVFGFIPEPEVEIVE